MSLNSEKPFDGNHGKDIEPISGVQKLRLVSSLIILSTSVETFEQLVSDVVQCIMGHIILASLRSSSFYSVWVLCLRIN